MWVQWAGFVVTTRKGLKGGGRGGRLGEGGGREEAGLKYAVWYALGHNSHLYLRASGPLCAQGDLKP